MANLFQTPCLPDTKRTPNCVVFVLQDIDTEMATAEVTTTPSVNVRVVTFKEDSVGQICLCI